MSSIEVSLGLDVGGTNIKAVALERPDKILHQLQAPSEASVNPEAVRKAIHTCVQQCVALRRIGPL